LLFLLFPEREVFFKEFDNGFSISEGLLIDVINLLESIGKRFLSKFTGLLVVVHNFVVEDREVKGKSKSDWVASVQRSGGVGGGLIVLKSTVFDGIKLITLGALSDVSIVISHHFVEESFSLVSGSFTHALALNNINDGDALVIKLLLDLLLINGETLIEFRVFWVLLDGTDSSNSSSLGANLVFETD